MVGRRFPKSLLAWDPVIPGTARFQLNGKLSNVSIVLSTQSYFSSALETMTQKYPNRDFQISVGDQNSRVGTTDPNVCDIVGPFNNGQWCSNQDRLLWFTTSRSHVIANTMSQHKPQQRITCHSNNGFTTTQKLTMCSFLSFEITYYQLSSLQRSMQRIKIWN